MANLKTFETDTAIIVYDSDSEYIITHENGILELKDKKTNQVIQNIKTTKELGMTTLEVQHP